MDDHYIIWNYIHSRFDAYISINTKQTDPGIFQRLMHIIIMLYTIMIILSKELVK